MIELWKNIPGYQGKYQANTEGDIRSVYHSGKTRIMIPYRKKSGVFIVKLTLDGKRKEKIVSKIIAETFIGPRPKGCVPYHKNGVQSDNYLQNIAYISRRDLGKLTGASSRRRGVVKINGQGELVEFYTSAREAARKNFMSKQTITDRCNGKVKSALAPDGHAYAWEDSEVSIKRAIQKLKSANGYMPKARGAVFDF